MTGRQEGTETNRFKAYVTSIVQVFVRDSGVCVWVCACVYVFIFTYYEQ